MGTVVLLGSNIEAGIWVLMLLFFILCAALLVLVISIGNLVEGYLKGIPKRTRDAVPYTLVSFLAVVLVLYLFFSMAS